MKPIGLYRAFKNAWQADFRMNLIVKLRRYTDIRELDAEIIREFVEKIIVYKTERIDGHKVQRIQIRYNGIGYIDLPNP